MAVRAAGGRAAALLSGVAHRGSAPGLAGCWTGRIGAKRHLLSDEVVRLQEFQQRKLAVTHQIYGDRAHYFKKLDDKIKRNDLILKDELKLLLHLCQTPEHVEVAKKAIYRYHEENRNVAFGEFRFGPLFVRLCYELGLEDTAAELALKGFFSDSTSFNIVMDMMFMKGYYETALEVLMNMRKQGVHFNKDTFTLAFAVCYKLNSPESYRICTALLEESHVKGNLIPRIAYCFAVALALRQEDIENAKSVYSRIMNTDSKICLNLKVLILLKSGAEADLLALLTSSFVQDTLRFVKKPEFSQEVISVVQEGMGGSRPQMETALSRLQLAGQVTEPSLDHMLCHTPHSKRKPAALLDQRKTSRRTFRPLQSALLSE
ncbi:pentatricopeptide repeat-containing protein 2, mitochondrial isoform X2 [Amia ocellicauda]|uniref:pentatricopeptide repeat-containing protein 2, mitochondrial isoform X2 n=1 Tax=Amia ocellicauda TaxID=2972642 RepID=UPI003463A114